MVKKSIQYFTINNIAGSIDYSFIPQLPFTCPKSTIETVEKGVKYVQS